MRRSLKAKPGTDRSQRVSPSKLPPGGVQDAEGLLAAGRIREALAIARDVMQQAKLFQRHYRQTLREAVACCYAIAQHVTAEKKAWAEFVKDEFWTSANMKLEIADAPHPLRHVILWGINGHEDADLKQASKWSIAVGQFFKDGVAASELPERIKEAGGLEALARANSRGACGGIGPTKRLKPHSGPNRHSKKPRPKRDPNSDNNEDSTHGNFLYSHDHKSPEVAFKFRLEDVIGDVQGLVSPCTIRLIACIISFEDGEGEAVISSIQISDAHDE